MTFTESDKQLIKIEFATLVAHWSKWQGSQFFSCDVYCQGHEGGRFETQHSNHDANYPHFLESN